MDIKSKLAALAVVPALLVGTTACGGGYGGYHRVGYNHITIVHHRTVVHHVYRTRTYRRR